MKRYASPPSGAVPGCACCRCIGGIQTAEPAKGMAPAGRVLVCVDGVHGLGVEDGPIAALGADFFVAGCHKWLFGPRGTGLVWGRSQAWSAYSATIPSFTADGSPGSAATPG